MCADVICNWRCALSRMTRRCCQARRRVAVSVMLVVFAVAMPPCFAFDSWGGSIGLTSDYLVRGISRSSHEPAVQGDLHFGAASGLMGGLFASSVRIAPGERRDAELSAFIGYAWNRGGDWRARLLATHYSYPWDDAGSRYNYDELSVDAGYRDWLNIDLVYSPNAPRYIAYVGLTGVSAGSATISLISPWRRRFALTAGGGYSQLAGPDATGYAYWSAGMLCDLAPWTMSVAYEDTNDAAKYLFFKAAARRRAMVTLIRRF
jgi:uncharacterized protein (TIGR02001 family)